MSSICPCCNRSSRLHNHHCHLRDLIRLSFQFHAPSRKAGGLILNKRNWTDEPRVSLLLRFHRTPICATCNSLDSVDIGSRPGPWFSFSPGEMKEIRQRTGILNNRGRKIRDVLREIRLRNAEDYVVRAEKAILLGHSLASEWL